MQDTRAKVHPINGRHNFSENEAPSPEYLTLCRKWRRARMELAVISSWHNAIPLRPETLREIRIAFLRGEIQPAV